MSEREPFEPHWRQFIRLLAKAVAAELIREARSSKEPNLSDTDAAAHSGDPTEVEGLARRTSWDEEGRR